MQTRNVREEDYAPISSVIDDWWGGRQMADMLPKFFFHHFQDTSFVVEEDGRFVAFLTGFISQTHPQQAYIHFVGVHPDYRKRGLAGHLYEAFFATVQARGCTEVHSITSPVNKGSIAFHTRLGFEIEPGDAEVDGIPVMTDDDGRGQSKVQFVRELTPKSTRRSDCALVVVDVQVAMFDERDCVGHGPVLLEHIRTLIEKARLADVPVIYIQHEGGADSALANRSEGWQIHPGIAPRYGDTLIEKKTPDSFYRTDLETMLEHHGVHRLVLCGIQSEVCVDTTCRRAFSLGYEVVLVSDAHGTWNRGGLTSEQMIENENDVLRWFADVTPTKEIVF